VEALEQELGRAAGDPEQVAEAREGDPAGRLAFADESGTGELVGRRRDRETVAHAREPALLLEEACELRVLDLDRVARRLPERGLEPLGLDLALAERGDDTREIRLRAAALEPEERCDLGRPRLGGKQL